eukprot:1275695-Rhodomonas_salina.1
MVGAECWDPGSPSSRAVRAEKGNEKVKREIQKGLEVDSRWTQGGLNESTTDQRTREMREGASGAPGQQGPC